MLQSFSRFIVEYADVLHLHLIFVHALKEFFRIYAECGRVFFQSACGKYVGLISICDRFSFQNAYVRPFKFSDIRGMD